MAADSNLPITHEVYEKKVSQGVNDNQRKAVFSKLRPGQDRLPSSQTSAPDRSTSARTASRPGVPEVAKNSKDTYTNLGPHPADNGRGNYAPGMTGDQPFNSGGVASATKLAGKGPIQTPGKAAVAGLKRVRSGHNQGFQRGDQPKDN